MRLTWIGITVRQVGCALALVGASAAASTAPPAPAQEPQQAFEEVSARVTTLVDGTGIVIDRGRSDGLAVGDRVVFSARGGAQEFGTVIELEGRNAIVRPEDGAYRPAAGTRVTIDVPATRFTKPSPVEAPKVPLPTPGAPDGAGKPGEEAVGTDPEASPWTRLPDEWTADMPLLAGVKAVNPADRSRSFTGRTYLSWDRIIDSERGRGDSFLRAGGALFADNPFGSGGQLHFDGEFNARRTQLPEDFDEDESDFRLDRLSYTLGGTRHDWNRLQFGRFLHNGMPEFGVLDGAAWSRRRENGDSYGASVGFLPEPDKDQQSLEDFQLAGWYRWVADERERFSLTGGYQKTWHNGTRDRDLVIAKLEYVPEGGWNVFGSAWIDLYGVGDTTTSGPELTYMILDARRNLPGGNGVDIEYRHQEYPELLRSEYPPVGVQQLLDAHVDRLSLTGWHWMGGDDRAQNRKRLWVRVGGWTDEEDDGGDGEVGIDLYGVLSRNGRLHAAVFTSNAKFSSTLGGRLRYGRYGPGGSWSAQYEIRQNDLTGFNDNNDDNVQHRLRGSYEFFRSSGLSASFSVEYQTQDREDQVFLGFFLQHAF